MSQTNTTTITEVAERFSTIKLNVNDGGRTQLTGPLPYNGALDKYTHHELTTAIGREYGPDLQLEDFIEADDATLRDLAHTGELLCSKLYYVVLT